MKLVIGLGNPGQQYIKTRHNVGFNVINKFIEKFKCDNIKTKFNGEYSEYNYKGEKVIFIKPQTFMNLSGNCVVDFSTFYKTEIKDILVIYDDIDIELGKIKIKQNGSAGTHNGMKSIVERLGSTDFPRIRVGISKNQIVPLDRYVIGNFSNDENNIITNSIDKAVDSIELILNGDITKAMNLYN